MPLYDALKGLYCLRETIGSGGFGKVKKGVHILTGETVAIKIMNKRKLGAEVPRVQTEIEAMQQLVHQNICQLYQVIETNEDFFLILEYCPNGELFDYIVMRNHLDEDQARFFFTQIVGAVAYIHHCGYAHRDLKPENLLLDDKGNLKLIDFGLCVKPAGGMDAHVSTCCGSPAYAAPELIAGKLYLGREADIWSLGVLLYALLCGFLPFDDSNAALLYRKIQLGKYMMPAWLSPNSCDLIGRMLQTDPKVRIKMGDLIRHPWVTNGSSKPLLWHSIIQSDMLDEDCIQVLKRHCKKSVEEMRSIILRPQHNYITATYKLLLLKKLQGKQAKLNVDQQNFSVPIEISDKEERVDYKKHFESTKIGAVVATSKSIQRRQDNKENVKSSASKILKNETLFVEEKRSNGGKCGAADTRDFADLHVTAKRIHISVLPVDLTSEASTKESSKQKSKEYLPEKKVKWNIPKMPQTNCMRGCGLNTDDENYAFRFHDRFKCCNSEKLNLDDDLFVFTDYRKRKVELDSLEGKERKITKTVIPGEKEAIYDNVWNLGLSPRTSDNLRKSRRRGNDMFGAGINDMRQKHVHMSPGQKLTRWKNNQRRKAPEMKFLSPECRKVRNSHNDWTSSQAATSGQISNKSKQIETDGTFQLPLSSVKTCRRVLDWVNASSESNITDDETDTKTSACRKLEFGSTSTDSGNPDKKSAKTFPSSEFNKQEVSSGASSSLLRKSFKSSTQNDADSSPYRNTVDCGKVLPTKDYPGIRNLMGSPWKSVESNLHNVPISQQTAHITSASVETELDHTASSQRNDKKSSIMENFERGMDRLLGIFTPKKKPNLSLEPRRVKSSHNVNLTSEQEAHLMFRKLKDALDDKMIQYKEKGFSLKCCVVDRCHQLVLSFSLEVVWVQKARLGVRHKRLTGDVWYYKRICESIFKLAKL